MSQYSIDQFSKITGLNKILIRTWENRYKFMKPKRTSTNIRFYDDTMLTKGIKYAILVTDGHKISKLVAYKDQHINDLIEKTLEISVNTETKNSIYISKFIESALHLNQELFDETYTLCIKEIGILEFYKEILMNTMNQIGILFLNSNITAANEHFLSENIRIKISSEIENIKPVSNKKSEWVLFLPENEYHDIGLLFINLILKKQNHKVIYLGQNIPRESLLALKNKNKNFLYFSSTKRKDNFSEDLCLFLSKEFNNSNIYTIQREEGLKGKYTNIKSISTIDEFINLID